MRTGLSYIFLTMLLAAVDGRAATWTVETVDPAATGGYTSLRIDNRGDAHVAYFDGANQQLKYGFWDSRLRRWFTTTVDRSAGFGSLALDSKQHPHIAHIDYGTGKLKYAHWDGSAWKTETLGIRAGQISFYTSIAVDQNDHPIISFYEYINAEAESALRLRTVRWSGSSWEVKTVDDTPGSGKFNSIAVDSSGHPQIAYANVKYENLTLRYAAWNGRAWKPQIIEGAVEPGYGVYSVSLALDQRDAPHIAYTDVSHQLVKYAVRDGQEWKSEVVDTVLKVSYPDRHGLALDETGAPYLSYYDAGSGRLKVAHKQASRWVAEVVDNGFAGFTSSLQISNGEIWVTYSDGNGLKAAHRKLGTDAEGLSAGSEDAGARTN